MRDDNKFVVDNEQQNSVGNQGINEEYNTQPGDDFIYVDESNQDYAQTNKSSIFDKLNTKMLVIIGLVILFLIFMVIVIVNLSSKAKYDDWLNKIRLAAKEHVTGDDDIRQAIEDGDKDKIYFFELIDGKHLSTTDLVNPKTKESVSKCNYVIVSTDVNTVISYDQVTLNQNVCPKQKPTITLLGDVEIKILQNEEYVDAGAEAKDYDGTDLTEDIKQVGEVDNTKVGTYTIEYSVKNSSGVKSSTVARTVIVEAAPVPEPPAPAPKPPAPAPKPYVDRTSPTVRTVGLPQTIKVGQTATYTFAYADNVRLRSIEYCFGTSCKKELVSVKSRSKVLTYKGTVVGTYYVRGTAIDTSGHSTSITKAITVVNAVDKTPPTIQWLNPVSSILAGTTTDIRIKFADNVGVSRYLLCLGSYCDNRSISPSITVIAPIRATLWNRGSYIITASAKDTSGNFTGNLYLGKIDVR